MIRVAEKGIGMSRGSVLVAILVMMPAVAAAQRPGGVAGGGRVATGAPRAGGTVARMAPAPPAHFSVRLQPAAPRRGTAIIRGRNGARTTNHRVHVNQNIVPFGPFGETEFQDVPGLGFDFPHLAATSGNRNPHFRSFGGVFPFGFNGFLLGAPPVILEEAEAADTPDARQEAEVQEVVAENARLREAVRLGRSRNRAAESARAARESAPEASEPRAPEPEKTAEYVFVRSDGSLVFAVGYSWDKDILRYVTRDGVRRTIKREALDLNATQEFNEQRGLSFHLG